ncbi:hypothetical protein MJD09_24855 [bacterium]|nr:hypothetical protein [bacterium]
MNRIAIFASILVLCLYDFSSAQKIEGLSPGMFVRLTAPPQIITPTKGRISAVRPDTLILYAEGSRFPLAIPRVSITDIELNKQRGTKAKIGAITGAAVVGVGVTILGLLTFEDDCPSDCPPDDFPTDLHFDCSDNACFGFSRPQKILFGSLLSPALGAGVGYLLGSLIKTEKWERVPLDQLRMGIRLDQQRSFAFSLSIDF